MKSANKLGYSIMYFVTSALLSAAALFSFRHYIEFVEQTAGSYNIVMLFGQTLRDFLLTVLLFVSGILAFLTFMVKSVKCKKEKKMYPFYLILMGILWIILPFLSVYTISRFTGTLILQTVSGIAIISNVVFMMISACCGIIALIDIVHSLMNNSKKESIANGLAMLLAGIPTGCALALLMTTLLTSVIGLSGIITLIGILVIIAGILNCFIKEN